jgi:hypothetical protein
MEMSVEEGFLAELFKLSRIVSILALQDGLSQNVLRIKNRLEQTLLT